MRLTSFHSGIYIDTLTPLKAMILSQVNSFVHSVPIEQIVLILIPADGRTTSISSSQLCGLNKHIFGKALQGQQLEFPNGGISYANSEYIFKGDKIDIAPVALCSSE